jgi:limonene-1,2-epoxide hydrolase
MQCRWLGSRAFVAGLLLAGIASVGCQKETGPSTTTPSSTAPATAGSAETVALVPPPSPSQAGFEFESPVRIEADGKVVQVEAPGYACPTMADVDGDGKEDLVVGQFNQGHMQFFRNIASSGESPRFASAEWIKTGEERAIVPGVW